MSFLSSSQYCKYLRLHSTTFCANLWCKKISFVMLAMKRTYFSSCINTFYFQTTGTNHQIEITWMLGIEFKYSFHSFCVPMFHCMCFFYENWVFSISTNCWFMQNPNHFGWTKYDTTEFYVYWSVSGHANILISSKIFSCNTDNKNSVYSRRWHDLFDNHAPGIYIYIIRKYRKNGDPFLVCTFRSDMLAKSQP